MRSRLRALLAAAFLLVALRPAPVGAQSLSGHRLGPLTFSGEATGSLAAEDTAFFNDTGYDVYPLRMSLISLSAELHLGSQVSILGEVVSENLDAPRVRGLYLRLRPLRDHDLDLQAGRIPPVFGSFARRSYSAANPLIGLPLGYQYLTTLRADAAPDSADGLLRVRGRGWLVGYPIGNHRVAPGLPLVSSRYWDTGIEARIGREPLSLAIAVTQGSLASPRWEDDNHGKQISARLGASPRIGLVLGLSGARGPYASRVLTRALPQGQAERSFQQTSLGGDAEYSWGAWLVRAEAVYSRFDLPELREPRIPSPVRALALSGEGVRRLAPGLYAAFRIDRLTFSRLPGTSRTVPWDAPVTRVEAGLGYQPLRPITLKVAYQRNWREEGYAGRRGFLAGQALVRF